jgi:hypothetical protein
MGREESLGRSRKMWNRRFGRTIIVRDDVDRDEINCRKGDCLSVIDFPAKTETDMLGCQAVEYCIHTKFLALVREAGRLQDHIYGQDSVRLR